ncbi:hypothetical protein A11A3_11938 [Alcanivorax hongdengensis A-11-3]|uniref:N-acetyltransferase domain-containing protein n=1 Tax=Alcanivorax hongdengensis A-11-3 TaxID=1177179 RepID=L0WDE0_9GAMM|nr:GNAT family N-acetyltransferase [Alcanivorax hongdengensis]EKF73790.1 hypothetical protein A11A3_11938 [Alcanivorax hongdengensis A-11-3]
MIRPLDAGDIDGLMTVFRDAIQVTAANDYDQQQRDAWSQAHDHNSLADLLAEGEVMVAEWEEKPVGFAQRQDDHINMVFVHPQASGLGIATLLCQHLEDSARVAGVASLTTHASLTAHDFFTYMGFVSEQREEVQRAGIALPRHFMRKSLQ